MNLDMNDNLKKQFYPIRVVEKIVPLKQYIRSTYGTIYRCKLRICNIYTVPLCTQSGTIWGTN